VKKDYRILFFLNFNTIVKTGRNGQSGEDETPKTVTAKTELAAAANYPEILRKKWPASKF
jgi:hypothetical protein